MTIVSVDLASRRYTDIGIAVLKDGRSKIDVELIPPPNLNLVGVPDACMLAMKLCTLAMQVDARLLILDSPQGWSGGTTESVIMRSCERATRTPGKTGLPGCVKPRPFARMVEFSIAVFDFLHVAGWPRLEDCNWSGDHRSIESFPTHAWRTLKHDPLRAKPLDKSEIERWRDKLNEYCPIKWHRLPSHDELQAVVAGLAGILMERYGAQSCAIDGLPPYMEDGVWREGFIVSPTAAFFHRKG